MNTTPAPVRPLRDPPPKSAPNWIIVRGGVLQVRLLSEHGWTRAIIVKRRPDLYEWMAGGKEGCHGTLEQSRLSCYKALNGEGC